MWSRFSTFVLLAALALGLVPATTAAASAGGGGGSSSDGSTFAVIGDIPYGELQVANFPYVVDQINADPNVEWVGHVGDIKSGSSVCSDEYFAGIRAQFDRFVDPLVYTPGDNEWTDCHRTNNGAYNPLERLDAIRNVFFPVRNRTLGQNPMRVSSQWLFGVKENVRFTDGDATFATAHVVGSNNGLAPWTGLTEPTREQALEVAGRTFADLVHIKAAFLEARARRSDLVVLMIQADMFDPTVADPQRTDYSGFLPIVHAIVGEASHFHGDVLLLDGDSHVFVEDRPLAPGSPWLDFYGVRRGVSNLTRITVEGSTGVDEYLKVMVDESAPAGFTSERVPLRPTPVTSVKINEAESQNGDPGDWVELANLSGVDLDVSGFVLKDDDDTHVTALPAGSLVPANGYLMVDEETLGYGLGGTDQVRFYAPDGVTLLDSTAWVGHAASTWGRCPDGTGAFQVTSSSTKGAPNDCAPLIGINEVESSGGDPGDWVELYNPGPSPSDISGWTISDNDDTHVYTIPAATVVGAGAYFVLDESAFGFGLGGGDSARLFRADGTLADSYAWTAHAAQTYGRCPDGTGSFVDTASSTKGAGNDCPVPTTTVVLNEVESNGGFPDDWVELVNLGAAPVDVSGWTVLDNDPTHAPYAVPAGTVINPGQYLIVENFGWGLGSADSVLISDSTGARVIEYSWTAHSLITWGRCPDGTGPFVDTLVSTKGEANACGSPVVINEIESSGGDPSDWVELYNPTGTPTDVSAFTFRDKNDAAGYVLPAGAVVPAQGVLVLDEATFGFALDGTDSARLFAATGALVDSFDWASDATTSYGRCPDGTGPFETTVASTKGGQNRCMGIPYFSPWPGGTDVVIVDDAATFAGNLSGLSHRPTGTATPEVLWAVQNGPGSLYRLLWNGTTWVTDAANDWGVGKAVHFPSGTVDVDAEGVVVLDAGQVYVGAERDNANSGVSRNSVLLFDATATGTTLMATREWELTADLPTTGANTGIEAVTFVPDAFLVANGFVDETTGAAYDPANYPNHNGGLFLVGVEATGGIYAYELDHVDGTFTRIATIASGFPGVMALEFDAELGHLWAVCDDTCAGRTSILTITGGAFTVLESYERPAGMANLNNEGFAIAPLAECSGGTRPGFYSDDSDTAGSSLRQSTLLCP